MQTEFEYIKSILNTNLDLELILEISKKLKEEILKIKNC